KTHFPVERWMCKKCKHYRKGIREVDIQIQERRIPDPPLSISGAVIPGAVLRDFLFQLPAEIIERDLYLGKIYGPDGKLNEKWVTFHGRFVLVVRGEKPSHTQGNCPECGKEYYFAQGKHFLTDAPPSGCQIFESDTGGLIVSNPLFEKLNVAKWKRKLRVEELPIHPVKKA
ncbi:MAG: hypothetical protein KDA68_08270, partial [Planctomycetaceae bacterium]|nr:hypothetical protein [Planctomycetaceae bacterium]